MTTQELLSRPRTFKELCQYFVLSPKTLRKLLSEAGLPARKKGSGRYYYSISELKKLCEVFLLNYSDSKCGEMWGIVGNCGEMWGNAGKPVGSPE